jgi:hypothetical protein
LVSVIAILTLIFFENIRENSAAWAGWVLAIVSIAAILATAWISFDQYKRTKKRDVSEEKNEINNVLQCLRDEIGSMSEGLASLVGNVLDESADDNIFQSQWYPAERQFMAFDACAEQVGKLPVDALGRDIQRTYAQARGLMLNIKMDAFLLEEAEAAKARFHAKPTDADASLIAGYDLGLQDYRDKLRRTHTETKASIANLLSALDQYLIENKFQ